MLAPNISKVSYKQAGLLQIESQLRQFSSIEKHKIWDKVYPIINIRLSNYGNLYKFYF